MFIEYKRRGGTERNMIGMIGDGLNLPYDTVLRYTVAPGHTYPTPMHGLVDAPDMTQTWWRTITYPVSLGRALHNHGGVGAAYLYVLEHIDPDTCFPYPETPHWHVPSEFLRRTCECWQRWNAPANQLEPLLELVD